MKKTANTDYFTHPRTLNGLEQFAQSIHQPLAPMLARFGLTVEVLNDPQAIIPYSAAVGLLETCALEWKRPDLGIQLGRLKNLEYLGAVGLVARLSDTVGDACHAIQMNISIHSNAYYLDIDPGSVDTDESGSIAYIPRPRSGCGPQMVELSLCRIYQYLSLTSGVNALKIREVNVQHAPIGSMKLAQQFFDCPVRFSMSRNAIFFDPHLLKAQTVIRDSAYTSIIQAYLQQERLQAESDVVVVTRRLTAQLLSTGSCTRDSIAEFLHLHPRTLHRRLLEHSTSFAEIQDEYRHARATEWVRGRNFSLAQISLMLGYANQSAFSSAYRRWTGSSPRHDRAQYERTNAEAGKHALTHRTT
ncbi:AraC family transcriptional regulator [Roseateles koreensis]|uniref:AraC family transcriptional regulator ligand-binding domain-containing protein n=1 Tax=Roseateles koreensis TaxID=2987526 RepID=A0ABT5KN07_9BURK|nr:AraC family transcriptional regulator [Roseateles koreensis]MDC8784269.1 AraC family transcriptional regulator ligand-binding domain-containing protein [Roseateles koreensis]